MEVPAVIGLCRYMCPEAEIRLRERENLLHPFEVAQGHTSKRPKADYNKCVAEYRRPTVGKQEVNPHDLRPSHTLVTTVNYLVDSIATRVVAWNQIYDFIFDRLRAVRQELVIQELNGRESIEILEKVVRFHVYSDYRLCNEHISVFDQKINDQHTQECLKRLINLYNNLGTSQSVCNLTETSLTGSGTIKDGCCQHQAEFEACYLIFNLGDPDALKHFYSLDKSLRNSPLLRTAYEMSIAWLLGNWVRVFRLAKRLTLPVHLCLISRHLPVIQRKALYTLNVGFSSKTSKFPLHKLTELLFLNTDTDAQHICQQFGLTVTGTHVHLFKTSFIDVDKTEPYSSDYIRQRVRQWSIPDLLHGRCGKQIETQLKDKSTDLQNETQVKDVSTDLQNETTRELHRTDLQNVTPSELQSKDLQNETPKDLQVDFFEKCSL